VLRILDRASIELDFSSLGFEGATRQRFETLLQSPNGILLVTGPTGSGKTTTLYTALRGLNREDNKVFTVEDPIEYQLPGVNQMQIQPRIGLTFAHALRSILRQDPDIIMVGEIRDLETADMAVQASLTGHLVLSTVHTNSAAATVARLTDMGVERFLLASAMKGILAQRLVRRLCATCAEAVPLPDSARRLYCEAGLADAAGADATMKRAKGCKACRHTGYRGRTVITELLAIDDQIRERIQTGTTERDIAGVARQGGMLPMYEDGLLRVLAGDTTLEEVLRVTQAA
jgi:general secretion pathway protein E